RQTARLDAAQVAERRDAGVLIRESQQVRTVAAERAAVLDDPQPTVGADLEPPGVGERAAVVQSAARLKPVDDRPSSNLGQVEILVPVHEIADAREHPSCAGALVARRIEPKTLSAA